MTGVLALTDMRTGFHCIVRARIRTSRREDLHPSECLGDLLLCRLVVLCVGLMVRDDDGLGDRS
jgi:hypothetical protein